MGTSKKQERTNGASTLEHVAPRSNPCPFLSSCDHMRLASWLHFVYKCTSSPAKPAAGGYFEARPFNEKRKKEKKNKKKTGRIPNPSFVTPLSSSKLSQPSTRLPDCQYREVAEFILPSMQRGLFLCGVIGVDRLTVFRRYFMDQRVNCRIFGWKAVNVGSVALLSMVCKWNLVLEQQKCLFSLNVLNVNF